MLNADLFLLTVCKTIRLYS